MELDLAQRTDSEAIRPVVRRSFRASYTLSPAVIDTLLSTRFGDDLAARLERPAVEALVARDDDGNVVGYGDGVVDGEVGTLTNLHVDPERRGEGAGTALLTRLRERLQEEGVRALRAPVLSANAEGGEFYQRHGFEVVEYRDRDLAGETVTEVVYERVPTDERSTDDVPQTVSHDGTSLFVDASTRSSGSHGPFYEVHRQDSSDDSKYGYYCRNCGAVVTSLDSMGRIECDQCGNEHRAAQWDGSYL